MSHSPIAEQIVKPDYKYQEWADALRLQIQSGALKPGDKLPSHVEMREKHGVSRPIVERAHAILESEGLIQREARKGAFVIEAKPAQQTTDVIGFCCSPLGQYQSHPYFSHLLTAIHGAANRAGRQILLFNSAQQKQEWDKIGGVLVYQANEDALEKQLTDLPPGMPCVCIFSASPHAFSVVVDDYHGSRAATKHLIELGHTRIGLLSSGQFRIHEHRRDGYLRALREAQIPLDPRLQPELKPADIQEAGFAQAARRAIQRWLQSDWAAANCTALVCQNDDVAIGVIEALQENGIQVPRDVSVVGFDGTEIADYFRPRLTTIKVPLREIGERGIKLLLEKMASSLEDEIGAPETIVTPVALKRGDSTAPPP